MKSPNETGSIIATPLAGCIYDNQPFRTWLFWHSDGGVSELISNATPPAETVEQGKRFTLDAAMLHEFGRVCFYEAAERQGTGDRDE